MDFSYLKSSRKNLKTTSKKIIYRSKCPFCENTNEFIRWSHSGCQNSYFYLDTFGDLTCSECYKVANLLEMQFACSSHSRDYPRFDYNNQLNHEKIY